MLALGYRLVDVERGGLEQNRDSEAVGTVLIVDDEPAYQKLVSRLIASPDIQTETVASIAAARDRLAERPFDVVLADMYLQDGTGVELVREIVARWPGTAVIVMSGRGSIELAVEAMRAGAADFLSKPVERKELVTRVSALLRGPRSSAPKDHPLVGVSSQMAQVRKLIDTFAPMDISILLLGETGTGKEVAARAIHLASGDRSGPFVDVDCSALPGPLLESELFGYEKGAFTDARERRAGKFEQAHGGTLFLDEIGNLSYEAQAKLLRVLQERSFRRLGGSQLIQVDVRVLAATNLDLQAEVTRGTFRHDLYFRLAEMTLQLPPLRERAGDVRLLCDHFVREYNSKYGKSVQGFTPRAMELLESYAWPGNVRELRSVVRTALLLSEETIDLHHLPPSVVASRPGPPAPGRPAVPGDEVFTFPLTWSARGEVMDIKKIWHAAKRQLEAEIINGLLRRYGYSRTELARYLSLDYKVLVDKLRELDIKM